ncbi:MAG: low molecular weight phosphatase family protein, partial [Alphaproteobacteria bacterium]
MTANADDTALPLPRSVLFLCNENAVRGPIAEALLARHARGRLYVDSVGLRRTEAPDPFCAAVLAELGIDIAGYGPKAIEDLAETGFDLVIALTRRAYEKAR